MRPLRHRVCDQSVDPDRGQPHRDSREQDQQHGVEARLRDREIQSLLNGADLRQCYARVDGLNFPAKRCSQAGGVARGAYDKVNAWTLGLGEWHVVGRVRVDGQSQVLHVLHDTDDLHPLVTIARPALLDALADGFLTRKETAHKTLTDDRHSGRIRSIVLGEVAALHERDAQPRGSNRDLLLVPK